MSLSVDISRCGREEDNNTLLALGLMAIQVQLDELTEKNWPEWWFRIETLRRLPDRSRLAESLRDPFPGMTLDVLKAFIGMRVNVTPQSRHHFMWTAMDIAAEYMVREGIPVQRDQREVYNLETLIELTDYDTIRAFDTADVMAQDETITHGEYVYVVAEKMHAAVKRALHAWRKAEAADGVTCDTCGDVSNSDPDLPCGRDLSEERGEADGTTICTGTYRTP